MRENVVVLFLKFIKKSLQSLSMKLKAGESLPHWDVVHGGSQHGCVQCCPAPHLALAAPPVASLAAAENWSESLRTKLEAQPPPRLHQQRSWLEVSKLQDPVWSESERWAGLGTWAEGRGHYQRQSLSC